MGPRNHHQGMLNPALADPLVHLIGCGKDGFDVLGRVKLCSMFELATFDKDGMTIISLYGRVWRDLSDDTR